MTRVLYAMRGMGAAAGRHAIGALLVIALAVGAYYLSQDEPEVCSRPNDLEAC